MAVDPWVFALIPILLLALFFYLVLRIISAVARSLGRLLRPPSRQRGHGGSRRCSPGGQAPAGFRTGLRICPNPHCRRSNVTVARYCAQCGQRL